MGKVDSSLHVWSAIDVSREWKRTVKLVVGLFSRLTLRYEVD